MCNLDHKKTIALTFKRVICFVNALLFLLLIFRWKQAIIDTLVSIIISHYSAFRWLQIFLSDVSIYLLCDYFLGDIYRLSLGNAWNKEWKPSN